MQSTPGIGSRSRPDRARARSVDPAARSSNHHEAVDAAVGAANAASRAVTDMRAMVETQAKMIEMLMKGMQNQQAVALTNAAAAPSNAAPMDVVAPQVTSGGPAEPQPPPGLEAPQADTKKPTINDVSPAVARDMKNLFTDFSADVKKLITVEQKISKINSDIDTIKSQGKYPAGYRPFKCPADAQRSIC